MALLLSLQGAHCNLRQSLNSSTTNPVVPTTDPVIPPVIPLQELLPVQDVATHVVGTLPPRSTGSDADHHEHDWEDEDEMDLQDDIHSEPLSVGGFSRDITFLSKEDMTVRERFHKALRTFPRHILQDLGTCLYEAQNWVGHTHGGYETQSCSVDGPASFTGNGTVFYRRHLQTRNHVGIP